MGTRRTQRSWSQLVLEGFLEEEGEDEDGGLGLGTEQCSAMQLGFTGDLTTGAVGGSRTCLAGLAWQTPARRFWGTTEGSVREWHGQTRLWGEKVDGSQDAFPIHPPGPGDACSVPKGPGLRAGATAPR